MIVAKRVTKRTFFSAVRTYQEDGERKLRLPPVTLHDAQWKAVEHAKVLNDRRGAGEPPFVVVCVRRTISDQYEQVGT